MLKSSIGSNGMQELRDLITSVQDEVRAVKAEIGSLPVFPKGEERSGFVGQCPPQISKLQNQLSRFEATLRTKGEILRYGPRCNPSATQEFPSVRLPAIMHGIKGGASFHSVDMARDRTHKSAERYGVKDISKPIRAELLERKSLLLMQNPQSDVGQRLLREKYNLPDPLPLAYRSCGQRTDLSGKVFSAKSKVVTNKGSYEAAADTDEGPAARSIRRPTADH